MGQLNHDDLAAKDTGFLDLARGGAALWVMMAHCSIWGAGGLWTSMVEPKKAVYLFMVISGFLMMYTTDKVRQQDWRTFYARRYFRIAPAYYLSLVAVIALFPLVANGLNAFQRLNPAAWANDTVYGAQYQNFGAMSVLAHLTFLFGFSPDLSFSTSLPDWSLALEMQFYATFPLIYMAVRRVPAAAVGIALTALSVMFMLAYATAVDEGVAAKFDEPSFLLFNLPFFLIGVLIYEAGLVHRWLNLGYAATIFAIMAHGTGHSMALLALMLAGMAFLWVFRFPAVARAFCRSRPVQFLSDTSYSVYLFHSIVLMAVGAPLFVAMLGRGWGVWAAVITLMVVVAGCTLVLAWGVHRFIEKPGIALGKRFTTARRPIVLQ